VATYAYTFYSLSSLLDCDPSCSDCAVFLYVRMTSLRTGEIVGAYFRCLPNSFSSKQEPREAASAWYMRWHAMSPAAVSDERHARRPNTTSVWLATDT